MWEIAVAQVQEEVFTEVSPNEGSGVLGREHSTPWHPSENTAVLLPAWLTA